MFKQPFAAEADVAHGNVKAIGIPRVGNVTATRGKIHQLANLFFGITAENAVHGADDATVHGNEKVVFGVILAQKQHRTLSLAGNAEPRKLRCRSGMNRIADAVSNLFGAYGRGGDRNVLGKPLFSDHIRK